MLMYNLIEYGDNYLEASGSLWQYYIDEPFINNNGYIIVIPDNPDNASFNSKQQITGHTEIDGTKEVKNIYY